MQIVRHTIGEAHEAIVREIFDNASEVVTEDNEVTFEWDPSDPVMIRVLEPMREPMISNACMFGRKRTEIYGENMLKITPPSSEGFSYTYPNRLFDYPVIHGFGDGNGRGFNQIEGIINKLISNPTSRRAIAHTWIVGKDDISNEPPCLQSVQCFVRNGKVNMVCYFRSNDMLSAWGQNAYGLTQLLLYIVGKINTKSYSSYEIGTLTTISASAHIYWKRDAAELASFKKKLWK